MQKWNCWMNLQMHIWTIALSIVTTWICRLDGLSLIWTSNTLESKGFTGTTKRMKTAMPTFPKLRPTRLITCACNLQDEQNRIRN